MVIQRERVQKKASVHIRVADDKQWWTAVRCNKEPPRSTKRLPQDFYERARVLNDCEKREESVTQLS